jgi:hypothetical protein
MSKSPDSFKFLTGKASPMDIHDRCKGRTTRDISARMTSLVKPFGSFAAGERCQGTAQFALATFRAANEFVESIGQPLTISEPKWFIKKQQNILLLFRGPKLEAMSRHAFVALGGAAAVLSACGAS